VSEVSVFIRSPSPCDNTHAEEVTAESAKEYKCENSISDEKMAKKDKKSVAENPKGDEKKKLYTRIGVVAAITVAVVIFLAVAFKPSTDYPDNGNGNEDGKIYCQPSDREAEACIMIYQPVCGWFDSEKVNCITHPCAETYSNPCVACMLEQVEYYTQGICPTR
jgi:hypothetical protein